MKSRGSPGSGPGRCHDVDHPGDLLNQPVVAEGAVVADVSDSANVWMN